MVAIESDSSTCELGSFSMQDAFRIRNEARSAHSSNAARCVPWEMDCILAICEGDPVRATRPCVCMVERNAEAGLVLLSSVRPEAAQSPSFSTGFAR
jgi:hypothetical protein